METQIIQCANHVCGAKIRLPRNKGMLEITCPKCKMKFYYNSGPKPGTTDNTRNPSASSTTRSLHIWRPSHEHKDLNNLLKDKAIQYTISIDGIESGKLSENSRLTLQMSSAPHEVRLLTGIGKLKTTASKVQIPAGTTGFNMFAFNNELTAGPVSDAFRNNLTQFLLKIYRGQGAKDRIEHFNNRHHTLDFSVFPDRLELSYSLAQTKGLKEWATGKHIDKIYYNQIGLTPPANADTYHYWQYLKEMLETSIEEDPQANMERTAFGFRPKELSNLY